MKRLVLSVLLALALVPSPAAADFHFVSIREVFPGETGWLDAEYVEMQAYAAGQSNVSGHSVTFYNAAGAEIDTLPIANDVDDGRSQMTFVMATAAAESRFGFSPDATMEPNLIEPVGGAICWAGVDCVSWGSFAGTLPSAGSPAAPAGIPDGMALRRTIAPDCATMLEPSDDRDNSALDFEVVLPAPRPNSSPIPESVCGGGGGAGGGADDPAPGSGGKGGASGPQTKLRSSPPPRTRDRTPTFRFGSGEAGARFECKLDRKPFRSCRSPFSARRLSFGRHTFQVRARDASGQADPTPAFDAFRVVRRLP